MMNSISGAGGMPGMGAMNGIQGMRDRMFSRADQNGDGGLDKAEMQGMANHRAERSGQSMNIDERFAAMDTDQDGLVSQSEFASAKPPEGMQAGSKGSFRSIMDTAMTGAQAYEQTESIVDLLFSDDESSSVDFFA